MYDKQTTVTSDGLKNGTPARSLPGKAAAWLALLRLPNLLTVPGDPLAGACLAAMAMSVPLNGSALSSCILGSLMLYSAGLLANDYCDRNEDARERPGRPIPSGRISANLVLYCSVALSILGVCAIFPAGRLASTVALLLSLASWAYNLGMKRVPIAGPLFMGSCRGLNLLLGAAAYGFAAVTAIPVLLSAIALAFLVLLISSIARHETHVVRVSRSFVAAFPVLLLTWLGTLALFLPALLPSSGPLAYPAPFVLILSSMAVVWITLLAAPLTGRPAPEWTQRSIGGMIRGLILVQAAVCAATGAIGELPALALLAAFPVAGWLGKWIRGS